MIKAGDLAIIIKAIHPENVGRIVEVESYFGDTEDYKNLWQVSFVGSPGRGIFGRSQRGLTPQAWLRPITGIPETEDQEEEMTA